MYTVYTITHDGVVKYVGKTCDFTKRKRDHLNRIGTFRSAIPVDVDLSRVEIQPIATFETNDDALKFEDEIILKFDTINNGWNKNRSGRICGIWSDNPQLYHHIYNTSDKSRAMDRERRQTEERKEWCRMYAKSEKVRKYLRNYMKTERYKEYKRRYQRNRRSLKWWTSLQEAFDLILNAQQQ